MNTDRNMSFGVSARWYSFWILDWLHKSVVRRYYKQIQFTHLHGTSEEETKEKIRKLISHAVHTTQYYRSFGENSTLEDLPIMNKEMYRKEYATHLSSAYKDASDNRVMYTSGSTGTPFAMVQNKQKINHNTAASIYLSTLGGYYIGMRWTYLRRWVHQVKKSWFARFKENMVFIDTAVLDDGAISGILQTIKQKKIKYVMGYASSLSAVAKYIERTGYNAEGFRVQTVLSTSELFPPKDQNRLMEEFGCVGVVVF